MQLVGALALGPHMWVLGARERARQRAAAAAARELERQYDGADECSKREMLEQRYEEEARAAAAARDVAAAAAEQAERGRLGRMGPRRRQAAEACKARELRWRARCDEQELHGATLVVPMATRLDDQKPSTGFDPYTSCAVPLPR